jgi:hypothetical protein
MRIFEYAHFSDKGQAMSNPVGWDHDDQQELDRILFEMEINGWGAPIPTWIDRSRVALYFAQRFAHTAPENAERFRQRAGELENTGRDNL